MKHNQIQHWEDLVRLLSTEDSRYKAHEAQSKNKNNLVVAGSILFRWTRMTITDEKGFALPLPKQSL